MRRRRVYTGSDQPRVPGCRWCTPHDHVSGPVNPCDACLARPDTRVVDGRPCPGCGRPLGMAWRKDRDVVVCHYCHQAWDLRGLVAAYDAAPDMQARMLEIYWPEGVAL